MLIESACDLCTAQILIILFFYLHVRQLKLTAKGGALLVAYAIRNGTISFAPNKNRYRLLPLGNGLFANNLLGFSPEHIYYSLGNT